MVPIEGFEFRFNQSIVRYYVHLVDFAFRCYRLAAKMMKNYGVSLSLPAPTFHEIKLIQHFD